MVEPWVKSVTVNVILVIGSVFVTHILMGYGVAFPISGIAVELLVQVEGGITGVATGYRPNHATSVKVKPCPNAVNCAHARMSRSFTITGRQCSWSTNHRKM